MKIMFYLLRTVAAILAAVLLVMFIAPIFIYHLVDIGNIVGIALCLWALIMCIAPVHRGVRGWFCKRRATKVIYRVVNTLVVLFLIYGAAVTAAMAFTGFSAPAEDATVVVLGAQVRPSGEPSLILKGRIQAGEAFLKAHPNSKAVLTGGKGSDEVISEAQCMYNMMTADGISPDRLFLEDRATDTAENFKFSQELIEENRLNSDLAITTDGFHQFRAQLIARKQGISSHIGAVNADTRWEFVPTYVVREWFALPLLLIK